MILHNLIRQIQTEMNKELQKEKERVFIRVEKPSAVQVVGSMSYTHLRLSLKSGYSLEIYVLIAHAPNADLDIIQQGFVSDAFWKAVEDIHTVVGAWDPSNIEDAQKLADEKQERVSMGENNYKHDVWMLPRPRSQR